MYLVIDVSTTYGGVGLWEDGTFIRSASWRSRHNHTSELMPAIDALLGAGGVGVVDLQGIAVAVGPGGFSALRAGLGVAKGFAFATGVPLAGVNTLEAAAYPFRVLGLPVRPMIVAGKALLSWATFGWQDGVWKRRAPDRVGPLEAAIGGGGRHVLFCGEAATLYASELREALGAKAHVVVEPAPLSRLQGVAELGTARLLAGDADSMAGLRPHYLRPPGITQPKRPQRVRAGAAPRGPRRSL